MVLNFNVKGNVNYSIMVEFLSILVVVVCSVFLVLQKLRNYGEDRKIGSYI